MCLFDTGWNSRGWNSRNGSDKREKGRSGRGRKERDWREKDKLLLQVRKHLNWSTQLLQHSPVLVGPHMYVTERLFFVFCLNETQVSRDHDTLQ